MTVSSSPPTSLPITAETRSPAVLVAVLACCGVMVALMQTLVVPLLPELPRLLHTSASNASWVVTATLLAGAVVTPISGRLGDMIGKRRVLAASLVVLVAGSVVCGVSSALIPIVIGRTLQGAAVGVIPLGISILRDELPADRVGSAIAAMSATLGVGGAIGLPMAAVIAQHTDWHALFWISAALGALCLGLVLWLVPESPVRNPGRFDVVGALGLTAGLTALLLAISKGGDWGWAGPATLSAAVGGVLVLLAWGVYEFRVQAPLVDLRVSARPRVLFTNLASIAVGFALLGMSLTFPQLLMAPEQTGYGFGLSMTAAGLAMAPGGLVMMALSPVSARISAARGPKTTLIAGSVVIGLGYLAALLLTGSVWEITLASMVIAGGIGIAYAAMPALIMGAVPIGETAAANGLNSLMRAIGTSTSSAVVGVVLAHLSMSFGGHELPSQDGFRVAFLISVAAAGVAIALATCIPMRSADGRSS